MEQKFSNNSLDLETLREFCKREGEVVTYRKGDYRMLPYFFLRNIWKYRKKKTTFAANY